MSLLAELEARGVTAEDLEKAAAVRLFEKAAAAEGVDLNDLDESRVEELFNHFVSTSTEKEASAMNDEIVELFEKTASAEGIDLDDMSDEDLAALYNHYIENVLPEQIAAAEEGEKAAAANAEIVEMFQKTASAEGIDLSDFDENELEGLFAHYVENVLPLQLEDEDATDKVADAQEKLAEAEILGRHMARAYADEMYKLAEESPKAEAKEGLMDKAKNVGRAIDTKAQSVGKYIAGIGSGGVGRGSVGTHRALGYGVPGAATATLAYGGKKMYNKRKSQEKRSSAIDYEDVVSATALQLLADAGYDV